MIENIKIKNFMAFSEEVEVKFSPKINVIIGENGTGKSQLLKLLQFLFKGAVPLFLKHLKELNEEIQESIINLEVFKDEFIKYFLPLDNKVESLQHLYSTEDVNIRVVSEKSDLNIAVNSTLEFSGVDGLFGKDPSTIFIPAKEVLSSMEGFVSMYDKYVVSFDKTYNDICLELDHPVLRAEKLREKSKQSIDKIEKLCGGKFIFHGGGKVTFKTFDDNELSVNAMAEGYRKIGMLARLLKTGAINFDTSGPLLWDEPEANMNPNIMKLLVEILLELARNGQQIILTTHDYVLLKWFDLLMDKKQRDEIHYHRLYRDEKNIIRVTSYENYNDISTSGISETYAELYNADIKRALG